MNRHSKIPAALVIEEPVFNQKKKKTDDGMR
jgi:hypothetical protein